MVCECNDPLPPLLSKRGPQDRPRSAETPDLRPVDSRREESPEPDPQRKLGSPCWPICPQNLEHDKKTLCRPPISSSTSAVEGLACGGQIFLGARHKSGPSRDRKCFAMRPQTNESGPLREKYRCFCCCCYCWCCCCYCWCCHLSQACFLRTPYGFLAGVGDVAYFGACGMYGSAQGCTSCSLLQRGGGGDWRCRLPADLGFTALLGQHLSQRQPIIINNKSN